MAETYADSTPTKDVAEDVKAAASDNAKLVKTWWREIERYNKAYMKWHEQGDKIVKRYLLDEREESETSGGRRFALLWSNVETLKPAIYAKVPQVVVGRRHKDADPIARTASDVLERGTNTTFDLYNVDEVLRAVRDDRLLPGRGVAWVRMEAKTADAKTSDGEAYQKVAGQKVCCDYVYWQDFGHNVCRIWSDVWVVWRKVFKTREEVEARWDKETADKLTYSAKDPSDTSEDASDKCVIFEVWDKRSDKTGWISKECPKELEIGDPPLALRNFFPCPEPCYATKTTRSLKPRPDYEFYRDQAGEIDDLTEKIGALTEWLQLKAFVPAGPSSEGSNAIQAMLEIVESLQSSYGQKGIFVPVENWAGFTEKGGSRLIDWLPIDMVAQTLEAAVKIRDQLIQDVYQITGLSDILRGQSDPNETLGAQEIKAQAGSRRVRNAKDEMARFARDLANIVAEVIAENFEPALLAEMTGYEYIPPAPPPSAILPAMMPPQPQPMGPPVTMAATPPTSGTPGPATAAGAPMPAKKTFGPEVVALLRNDKMRGFLIDIETDSTVQPDEDAEKQRRVEFVTAVGGLMKEAMPVLQMTPQLAPMIAGVMKFVVRGFRAGRELEDQIEQTMDQLSQELSQPKPPPPDPKMIEAETKAKAAQADAQLEAQKAQTSAALEARKQDMDAQLTQRQQDLDFQAEMRKAIQELQHQMMGGHADRQMQAHNANQDRALAAHNAAEDRAAQKLNGTQEPGA